MRNVMDAVDLTTKEKIYYKGHAKVTYLSDGRNVEDALEEIPTAESLVFKAVYGETTYEEIKAAYDSGKVVHCDYETYCYVLTRVISEGIYFCCPYSNNLCNLICRPSASWTKAAVVVERTPNKVTSLSESSTDIQYPSAKAVYDFVQNSITNVLNEEV